jgi:hypothetical protein
MSHPLDSPGRFDPLDNGVPSVIVPPIPLDPGTARGLEAIAYSERMTPAALVRRVLAQYVTEYRGLPG